jgi:hypothetical protein
LVSLFEGIAFGLDTGVGGRLSYVVAKIGFKKQSSQNQVMLKKKIADHFGGGLSQIGICKMPKLFELANSQKKHS